MKPLYRMSERERRKEEIRLEREERLQVLIVKYRAIYPRESESFYKRMAVRRLAWEDTQW